MKKLMHIIATPRGDESRTLKVSRAFLDVFRKKYPACEVDELNVCIEKLPDLTVEKIDGKYVLLSGKELSPALQRSWQGIIGHIERFISADAYLVSCPMWNFSIPYGLKQYIDIIMQPKYLFRYTASGAEGLLKNKRMVIVTSRGGDYSDTSPSRPYDMQEPYLRNVFGFAGISDITFVNAEPMDALGPDVQAEAIRKAQECARGVAENF